MAEGIQDRIYQALTDDAQADSECKDISDAAREVVPQNFLTYLCANMLSKLGDTLANPKTTLPWLASSLGAPGFVISMLVPIRESGSMIPQVIIGAYIKGLPKRKWIWIVGSLLQGLCIAGIALSAWIISGLTAGLVILGLVTCFSLARGLCSITGKDVVGKTIPKGKRGQLNGWATSGAGLISLLAAIYLMVIDHPEQGSETIAWLLITSACLWVCAALVFCRMAEQKRQQEKPTSGIQEVFSSFAILGTDRHLLKFVIARALLMSSALSAPFYVALAHKSSDSNLFTLGLFIVASGLAGMVSGPLWGRFADTSSRGVMAAAGAITSLMGFIVAGAAFFQLGLLTTQWFFPLAFFILSVAHNGVRVGRKTYVVDLATADNRTTYVAVSNTTIGILLLGVGTIGLLESYLGIHGVIALLATMAIAGLAASWLLKPTKNTPD